MVPSCSCTTGCYALCISDAHHTLVEYLDHPLSHRQEHFLEGNVPRYGGLNLDQINDVITKEAILVVLLEQLSYRLHHTPTSLWILA